MNFEELAKRIGVIQGNEPVTALDVQAELRSKSYVVQGGKLSPSEFVRLKVYAKKRAIKRVVDESFANDAARTKQKTAPKRNTAEAMARSALIDQAMAVAPKRPLAWALGRETNPLFNKVIQAKFKLEAWAGFRAGPVR